jgi:DNA-binding SARP family transcriptional activator/TolB-like protein
MIELTLLGLQAVRGSDGREFGSLPAQPKRFALLAFLAISGGGGFHRRDSLAAMFWPDLDQFAARRALRNTLYHLREAIGDGILIAQGDDALAIDPERMTCDVTRLASAVAEGRFEEAVDLYRGELLAGMHFANAGEAFEDWLFRERARVTELVLRALGALVDREERARNVAAAAYWAQRACTLASDDEKWLRRAMTLLEASDDRGDALRLYDAFARRLAAEFNSKPSPETAALATRIREGSGAPKSRAPVPTAPPADSNVKASPQPLPLTAVDSAPPPAPSSAPPEANESVGEHPDAAPSRMRRGRWWAAGAAAITVVVIAALLLRTRNVSHAHAPARTRVLVAMFDNRTGDARFDALGPMAEDWLSQGLLRTQIVDVVDPHAVLVQSHSTGGAPVDLVTLAHRTGAAMVVSGSYYRTGDSVLFQASLTDVGSTRIVRVVGPIGANINAPVGAIDELRSRVMTALASQLNENGPGRLDVGGSAEIPPFEVYQEYVEGRDAYWHGDATRALALLLTAAQKDPAFTSAAIAAVGVASNFGQCALVDSIARALSAAARPIDRVERLSIQIGVARCHGHNEEMLRLTLERAELAPRTSGLRLSAAAAALYANRPKRALQLLKSIDPSTELSWSTDSSHFGYWSGVTESLHILGRHDEELAEASAMPNVAPLSRSWLRARALAALRRPADVLALIDTALTQQTETSNDLGLAPYTAGRPQYGATPAWVAVWVARELSVHGDTATSRQVAARALAWYRARPQEERATIEERLVAAWSLELMGSYADAERMMKALAAEDAANVDYQGGLAGLAAEQGESPRTDSIDRWLSMQHGDAVSWTASFYRARDAALLSHDATAIELLRQCMEEGAWPYYLLNEPAFGRLRTSAAFESLLAPKD